MCHSKEELLRVANWPGVKGGARERLMDQLQGNKRCNAYSTIHVHVQYNTCTSTVQYMYMYSTIHVHLQYMLKRIVHIHDNH